MTLFCVVIFNGGSEKDVPEQSEGKNSPYKKIFTSIIRYIQDNGN